MRRFPVLALVLLAGCPGEEANPPTTAVEASSETPFLKGHVDWQGHPAMHLAWPHLFEDGLNQALPSKKLTWDHRFQQSVYVEHLRQSRKDGIRILVAAAYAAERAFTRAQAFQLLHDQLDAVEAFVAKHADEFAIAKTPEEARAILTTTDKTVVVHSIEGGRLVLDTAADVKHWSDRGVVLITLIHLWDDEFGGAAIVPGAEGMFLNPVGLWKQAFAPGKRGLTEHGRLTIARLAKRGILVDLSHMTPLSIDDSLSVCENHGIPPVVTHGAMSTIRNVEMSFTPQQILRVYKLGGAFSIPSSAHSLDPIEPSVPVPADLKKGTIDAFRFHHEQIQAYVFSQAPAILGHPVGNETDAVRLSVGWSSDWNGFLKHTRPYAEADGKSFADKIEYDEIGLAHPGMLGQYFQRLQDSGMDLQSFERSVEQFLRVWTLAREKMETIP